MCSQLDIYKQQIEFAPIDPGAIASGLLGFVDAMGYFICSRCSGRLGLRGFQLKAPACPVWDTTDETCAICKGGEL